MEFFAGIGAGWMNLASLALGLLAWMLPVAAMIRTAARPRALHPALPLVCVSFAACAAALYLQLRYHAHLSRIEDVGAFLDTAQAAAFASAVLLCVTRRPFARGKRRTGRKQPKITVKKECPAP